MGAEVFPEQWVAIILAFQSQCWHTDDVTGHCLVEPDGGGDGGEQPVRDGSVRIVAALVNPAGHDPGRESVTLINITPERIDLSGWAIADKNKATSILAGLTAGPGEAVTVKLDGTGAQLGNKGGMITLLDPAGLKVDGVAYTKSQVSRQGWSIVF